MVPRIDAQPRGSVAFFIRVAAVLDQKPHHVHVGVSDRAAEGMHSALVLGVDVRAFLQKEA